MTSGDHLARELLLIKLQLSADHVEAVEALLRRIAAGSVAASSSYIVELTSTRSRSASSSPMSRHSPDRRSGPLGVLESPGRTDCTL